MSERPSYSVLVARMKGWWCVEVPSLSVLAECDSFGDAEAAARESITLALGSEGYSFDLSVELRSPLDARTRAPF